MQTPQKQTERQNKAHMIISLAVEKAFDKNQTSLFDRSARDTRDTKTYLNTTDLIKAIYTKPTSNSILNGEKLKQFG